MSKILLTGASGFLGFHTKTGILEAGDQAFPLRLGELFDPKHASQTVETVDQIVHLAGINRGTDQEVHDGNILFANQLISTLESSNSLPKQLVFANSSQAGNGSIYGSAKARAEELLAISCERLGIQFLNVALPNLFGEHGRPGYNMVTSTFCDLIASGQEVKILSDNSFTFLHAQDAADLLLGNVPLDNLDNLTVMEDLHGLRKRILGISEIYATGEIPDVSEKYTRDLFNTYRSHLPLRGNSFPLLARKDQRGSFFEIVRARGGQSQTSFSTTEPGNSRGDHFHRRKIERFTVLSGEAIISMRKLFSNEIIEFRVSGDEPTAVDMPTMWPHKIENVSGEIVFTSFWTDDPLNPNAPDTIYEKV